MHIEQFKCGAEKVVQILNKIKSTFSVLRALKNIRCPRVYYRISSVDAEEQTVILHIIHKSVFIKQTFSEIISDSEMIEGLSCKEACWIGVYYGKALRSALDRKSHLKHIKKPNYLLKHRYGRYKIISENRDGTIECIHIKSRKEISTSPIYIAKDTAFINHFDANQACYIGILAGMAMEKKEHMPTVMQKQMASYLKVVK